MSPLLPDAAEVKSAVSLVELVGGDVVWDRKKSLPARNDYWAPCPFHQEKTASFHVVEHRRGDAWFKCLGCGVSGGSVIDYIMRRDGVDFQGALKWLRDAYGIEGGRSSGPSPEALAREAARRAAAEREALEKLRRDAESAGAIWDAASDAHPLLSVYLGARIGAERRDALWRLYRGGPPPGLRVHPDLPLWEGGEIQHRGPCLVALAGEGGRRVGLHRTWLRPDGLGRAVGRDGLGRAVGRDGQKTPKKILGKMLGADIRFGRPRGKMLVGEGIETTLAELGRLALAGLAGDPWSGDGWSAVCAISLPNIAGAERARVGDLPSAIPDFSRPSWVAPEECRELVILGDGDMSNPEAARLTLARAQKRHSRAPWGLRRVRVDWAGGGADSGLDHADLAIGK